MGRIKTSLVKRITNEAIAAHPDEASKEFEKNKAFVQASTTVMSKKMRNVIAGYVTRQKKNAKEY
ncbi:30S ribosomal protein S17e [Nanoarchaeota archaeon]